MRFALLVISTLSLAWATPLSVMAQSTHDHLKGFWSNGDARNWDQAVTPNSSQAVSYRNYPLVVDKLKAEAEAAQQLRAKLAAEQQNQQNPGRNEANQPPQAQADQPAESSPPPASTPLSREQIVAKFGSPEQPQLIRAQKDAPPAMQGLFEALNSNDKELAWQYAVALARRQVEMQSVVSKATDYQMLAMESLGIQPAAQQPQEGEAVDPIRAEVQEFMAQTRRAELGRQVNIDPNLGQEALGQAPLAPSGVGQAARLAEQVAQIPVDPEGRVKVLIFFDEKSEGAKDIMGLLRPLAAKFKADPQVSLLGLTKRTYSTQGLKLKGAELSSPFPLLSGEALALDLRIQSYPTVVFVAATSRQTYRTEGIPTLEEIERTVKVMRGVK
jgi:hypothetical protein